MMRKVHRVALAAFLKPAIQELMPGFVLATTAWARALGTERRFTFVRSWGTSFGFLIFEPSATATDDYFTVDMAWVQDAHNLAPADIGDDLTIPLVDPWRQNSSDDVLARRLFRLRLDDLWKTSPIEYRGSFRFSTASSRYIESLALIRGLAGKEREDRAFELLQNCMAEEKATSESQALSEVSPAAGLALRAVEEAAVPAFRRAEELARAAK